jgi:hypothetical protein
MRRVLALCAVVLLANQTLAWNKAGHLVVSLIAYDVMDEDARAKAVEYLRKHPRFEDHFFASMPDDIATANEEIQDRWVFAWSSQWPDQVKRKSGMVTRDDVREFSRNKWHYINVPAFLDDDDREILEDDVLLDMGPKLSHEVPPGRSSDTNERRSMNCVQALKVASIVTASDSVSDPKKGVYICWLTHLTGDVAQPLHSTALFTAQNFDDGDEGGNGIKIGSSTLHSVWDGRVHRNDDYNSVRGKVEELKADAELMARGADAASELDFAAWIDESHKLAVASAYTPEILEYVRDAEDRSRDAFGSITLNADYYEKAAEIAEVQAVIAGHRLAKLIEQVVAQ